MTNSQNTRKSSIRKNVVEKYYLFLCKVYETSRNNNVNLQKLCKEFKISTAIPNCLEKLNYANKVGRAEWVWNGKKPSYELTLIIIENLRFRSGLYQKPIEKKHIGINFINTGKDQIPEKKVVKQRIKKLIETPVQTKGFKINFLWGMFNYEKN